MDKGGAIQEKEKYIEESMKQLTNPVHKFTEEHSKTEISFLYLSIMANWQPEYISRKQTKNYIYTQNITS